MSFLSSLGDFALFNIICNWFSGKRKQSVGYDSLYRHQIANAGHVDRIQDETDMWQNRLDDKEFMEEMDDNPNYVHNLHVHHELMDDYDDGSDW